MRASILMFNASESRLSRFPSPESRQPAAGGWAHVGPHRTAQTFNVCTSTSTAASDALGCSILNIQYSPRILCWC